MDEWAGRCDLAITIDGGDGSALQGFTGQGDQTATHPYTGDVTAATVTVTGTDIDGNVASDSASVDLLGAATATTTAPTSSTTTSNGRRPFSSTPIGWRCMRPPPVSATTP